MAALPSWLQLGDLSVLPVVAGYALCSSLLAVVNKAAISVFPFPSALTAIQYLTALSTVWGLGSVGVLELDPVQWSTIRAFFPAALVFYLAIFTNAEVLKHANLDTFIVFRSSTPLMVALADYFFRGQPWPSRLTFGSLGLILLGAIGYVITDNQFTVAAYSWALAYLATITFEMVYIKHVIGKLELTTWSYVLYNNLISLALSPIFFLLLGELFQTRDADRHKWLQPTTFFPVALSCVLGVGISFFGFACRRAISATSFTVVGVTNKLLTVVVNVTIWDKHSKPFGIACLLVTIVGGVLYQQSMAREKPVPPPPAVESSEDDEKVPLKSEVADLHTDKEVSSPLDKLEEGHTKATEEPLQNGLSRGQNGHVELLPSQPASSESPLVKPAPDNNA